MNIGNPLLFLWYREASKVFRALSWAWRYVEYASEDAYNLEAQAAKGHVGEALFFFRVFSHAWL